MAKKLSVFLTLYYLAIFIAIEIPQSIWPKFKIVFFDVGQGDSALITYGGKKILIDTGKNHRINQALNTYFVFPFCKFDLVIISHVQEDHSGGLRQVLSRCKIDMLWINDVAVPSKLRTDLWAIIKKNKNIKKINRNIFSEKTFNYKDLKLITVWPDQEFFADFIETNHDKSLQAKLNDISILVLVKYKDFEALFTGDSEKQVLNLLDYQSLLYQVKPPLDVLKVPHHGSKNGLDAHILDLLHPKSCVISVGVNSYGHPAPTTLSLLGTYCHIYRTDIQGNIEFVFD